MCFHRKAAQWLRGKKATPFPSEVIPSQGDEGPALSIRKLWACVAGNRRNTRNNRSFPAPLNAPVWLYQPGAHSFSFNQKRRKGEVRKNRGPVANKSYLQGSGSCKCVLKPLYGIFPPTVNAQYFYYTQLNSMPEITSILRSCKKAAVSTIKCSYWRVKVVPFL